MEINLKYTIKEENSEYVYKITKIFTQDMYTIIDVKVKDDQNTRRNFLLLTNDWNNLLIMMDQVKDGHRINLEQDIELHYLVYSDKTIHDLYKIKCVCKYMSGSIDVVCMYDGTYKLKTEIDKIISVLSSKEYINDPNNNKWLPYSKIFGSKFEEHISLLVNQEILQQKAAEIAESEFIPEILSITNGKVKYNRIKAVLFLLRINNTPITFDFLDDKNEKFYLQKTESPFDNYTYGFKLDPDDYNTFKQYISSL